MYNLLYPQGAIRKMSNYNDSLVQAQINLIGKIAELEGSTLGGT